MHRFNDNPFLHSIGRHITKRAVQDINISSLSSEINYKLKARSMLKNSIYVAGFIILRNSSEVGKASKVKIGNTLLFEIDNKKYKAHSPLSKFREINFYELDGAEELTIGKSVRQNLIDTKTFITIDTEKNFLDPLLCVGLTWLHSNVK
ncbi:hypothetical protein JOE23_002432 [Amphibacillus cookii]|nr:hypothetical protein [Amphibacillus cookii]MBM7542163.1 hypothetical protein [Amphibacillus cookii]